MSRDEHAIDTFASGGSASEPRPSVPKVVEWTSALLAVVAGMLSTHASR